jgi:hypothetical protein
LTEARIEAKKTLTAALTRKLIDEAVDDLARALEERRQGEPEGPAKTSSVGVTSSGISTVDETSGHGPLLVYVYGVGEQAHTYRSGLTGITAPHDVEVVQGDGLQAFVSSVPSGEFGEKELQENLNDLEWLRDRATAHQHVLESLSERGQIVPMRFCTIYESRDRVRHLLSTHGDVLRETLASIRGRSEWGVKMLCDVETLARRIAPGSVDRSKTPAGPEGEGTSYLLQRKEQEETSRRVETYLAGVGERLHQTLDRFAEAFTKLPPQSPEVRGDDAFMPFNRSYLVPDELRDDFTRAVRAIQEEHGSHGLSIEVSGPWAPYTFVTLDLTEDRVDETA